MLNEKAYKFSTRDSTEFTVETGSGSGENDLFDVYTITVNTLDTLENTPESISILDPRLTNGMVINEIFIIEYDNEYLLFVVLPAQPMPFEFKLCCLKGQRGMLYCGPSLPVSHWALSGGISEATLEIDGESRSVFEVTGDGTITLIENQHK